MQRMWEFSIGLVLLDLQPDSLALVALFGLTDSLAQVLAGPYVGAYIDGHVLSHTIETYFILIPGCKCGHPEAAKLCYKSGNQYQLA